MCGLSLSYIHGRSMPVKAGRFPAIHRCFYQHFGPAASRGDRGYRVSVALCYSAYGGRPTESMEDGDRADMVYPKEYVSSPQVQWRERGADTRDRLSTNPVHTRPQNVLCSCAHHCLQPISFGANAFRYNSRSPNKSLRKQGSMTYAI